MYEETKEKTSNHFICVISSSITDTRLSMLTSPKYFTAQRQMWRNTLQKIEAFSTGLIMDID